MMIEPPELVAGDAHRALETLTGHGFLVDSIVTDPPWDVNFDDWTGPSVETWQLMMKVLKPGGFMAATAFPKTMHRQMVRMEDAGWKIRDVLIWLFGGGFSDRYSGARQAVHRELLGRRADMQRGMTHPQARKWEGWGSALRPAWMPIVLCQAPREHRLGRNLVELGVGALNLNTKLPDQLALFDGFGGDNHTIPNVLLEASAEAEVQNLTRTGLRALWNPKISPKEKHAGTAVENDHPTVNPNAVFRWLISLVTPPGGLVLDPFCGTGTTGIAATMEDCRFLGIDLDPHYIEIAKQRIAYWREQFEQEQQEEIKKVWKPPVVPHVRIMFPSSADHQSQSREGERCRKGHLLTPLTIYIRPDGRQECKICKRMTKSQRKALGATG